MELPNNDTIEVTLIGTGGGYGESVVIHLGNQEWIVIDSCKNPKTNTSLPLEYLESIGVDVANHVKLIICTHWHDDHIQGISDLLYKAKNAIFSFAKATDRKKFIQLIGYDYNKIKIDESISSTYELNTCLEIIDKSKQKIKFAYEDRTILSSRAGYINYEIISLSPSDQVMVDFDKEISTLFAVYANPNKKVVIDSPNDKSIVLFVKINEHRILLGSDLEYSNNDKKGWLCILDNSQCVDEKAHIFKIPHHGSETAYHERLWNEIVDTDAVAKLTPWNRGSKLPQKEMLDKFLTHTPNLYATSLKNHIKGKPKNRDRSLTKAIKKFNSSLSEIRYEKGIVRCRTQVTTSPDDWEVVLFDEALKITKDVTNKMN